MKFFKLRFIKDENGNMMLLFILLFAIFMGVTGLVIDMGVLYKTKSELRKTANAAAFSGAQELLNSDDAIRGVVTDILNAHNAADTYKNLVINDEEKKVTITLEKNVPLNFMKFFGMSSVVVNADATAGIFPASSVDKPVPLGIDETDLAKLKPGDSYTLKVGAGDAKAGNYGILALSGVGARNYLEDLMYGYQGMYDVGLERDVLTQTGNIAGNTKKAIEYRIANCPYTLGDTSHEDDPRRVKILVYKPNSTQGNQIKSVKVKGFALFYINKVSMSSNEATITGQLIEGVCSGTASPTQQNYGAYAVKLMKS